MDCTSPYHYDARTQTYHLPVLSADLLTRIKNTNQKRLSQIRMQKDVVIERMGHAPKAGTSLLEAVEFGIRENFVSPLVLEHVLTELGAQTQCVDWHTSWYMISCWLHRFPFLLAVDDFQALYCKSQYKTPQYVPINGYHLSLPRLLLEFAAGVRKIVSILSASYQLGNLLNPPRAESWCNARRNFPVTNLLPNTY
jgi:small subunit ribosomal protein S29